MSKVVLVTDAGSVVGSALARALADRSHWVFAGVDPQRPGYQAAMAGHAEYAQRHGRRLTGVALSLGDQRTTQQGVDAVIGRAGGVDVVVHVVEFDVAGPVESFTAYQLAQMFDWMVLRGQRVSRAVLPSMRRRGSGQVVWVGLWSVAQGHGGDGLDRAWKAMSGHAVAGYAEDLSGLGVEVCGVTVAVGAGLVRPVLPDDRETAEAYGAWPGSGDAGLLGQQDEAEAAAIAEAVARLLASSGGLPRRVQLDPASLDIRPGSPGAG